MGLVICGEHKTEHGIEIVFDDGVGTMHPADCPVCEREGEIEYLKDEIRELEAQLKKEN